MMETTNITLAMETRINGHLPALVHTQSEEAFVKLGEQFAAILAVQA